jgi:hypothetical protein
MVGPNEFDLLGYKLGTIDRKTLGSCDIEEGAKVGSSLIPTSPLTSVGPEDGKLFVNLLGISDGTSLGPGDAEGANVGSSLIPLSMLTSVGPDDSKLVGYELGTSDGTSLGPGDAEGANVGTLLVSASTVKSVGPEDGILLG